MLLKNPCSFQVRIQLISLAAFLEIGPFEKHVIFKQLNFRVARDPAAIDIGLLARAQT